MNRIESLYQWREWIAAGIGLLAAAYPLSIGVRLMFNGPLIVDLFGNFPAQKLATMVWVLGTWTFLLGGILIAAVVAEGTEWVITKIVAFRRRSDSD